MNDKSLKIENVDPVDLVENPWNTNIVDPDNEDRLEQAIDRFGMFKPVICRTLDDGSLQILGGAHRVKVARRKHIQVPVINLGVIDEKRAKEISLVDNGRYGIDDSTRLTELLQSIGDEDEISSFLPYSEDELSAIFSSSSIDLDELDLPDDEPAPPPEPSSNKVQTHQVMRFKVPVEDASNVSDLFEAIMKEHGFNQSDSMTNAGDALVHMSRIYKDCDHEPG